jgi:predicted aspartyl protease
MVQVRQGKLNFTTMSDIPEGAFVLTGTFTINDTPVKILFDSGATHSFISEKTDKQNGFKGFSYQFRLQDNYPSKANHL